MVVPQNILFPTVGGVGGSMVMEVKLLQNQKQLFPRLVTELGMLMEVKLLQP